MAKTFQQVSQDSNYSKSFIEQKSEFLKNNNFVTRQLPINDCILDENFKMLSNQAKTHLQEMTEFLMKYSKICQINL